MPLFAALRIFSVDKIRDTRAYREKMENFQAMSRKCCFGAIEVFLTPGIVLATQYPQERTLSIVIAHRNEYNMNHT